MTTPTPDYLRTLAVAPNRFAGGWRISAVVALQQAADALAAVTAERDQVQAETHKVAEMYRFVVNQLADAPHHTGCQSWSATPFSGAHCNCWKAGL